MIDPKQALEDAATHVETEGAVQVWLTEAMIRHWQADALEAAAQTAEVIFDPSGAVEDAAKLIRKLKPEAT